MNTTNHWIRNVATCSVLAFAALVSTVSSAAADGPGDPVPREDVGTRPAPPDSAPAGSKAPITADGRPAAQPYSRPPERRSSGTVSPMGLIPIGTSRPPSDWAYSYLVMTSGGKCYSKVTQYDVGWFPLFTHDLHTWASFTGGISITVWDEWIQQYTWNGWQLTSNSEGHYPLSGDTMESWANSAYNVSAPSPFYFYNAWPYMRNRISWFGQCRSENSSLSFEEFPGLHHLWYRNTYQ